jgi:hypothetical protein
MKKFIVLLYVLVVSLGAFANPPKDVNEKNSSRF